MTMTDARYRCIRHESRGRRRTGAGSWPQGRGPKGKSFLVLVWLEPAYHEDGLGVLVLALFQQQGSVEVHRAAESDGHASHSPAGVTGRSIEGPAPEVCVRALRRSSHPSIELVPHLASSWEKESASLRHSRALVRCEGMLRGARRLNSPKSFQASKTTCVVPSSVSLRALAMVTRSSWLRGGWGKARGVRRRCVGGARSWQPLDLALTLSVSLTPSLTLTLTPSLTVRPLPLGCLILFID